MDNPFKKILTSEKVPEILREKIINDIAFVKLSLDVADLFAVKYPGTIKELLMTEQENHPINKPNTPKNNEIIY